MLNSVDDDGKRVAVVTGTAHGIGATIANTLRAVGVQVHGIDKDTVDVTDAAQVASFFESLDRVDILVNCAGGVCGHTFAVIEEVTDDAWRDIVDANLTGTFFCTRAAVPAMKKRRWGRIVNISSGAGRSTSLTGIQAYVSAKAGQIGLTRQLARELGPFGITVNCIAPGLILSNPDTERQWVGYGVGGQARILAGIATGRLGSPDDIANGVMFFVSAASGWMTGQTLSIDGGMALF